ncbi:5668_t:CDS:2 [Rhizophagus irregularis]|nr:5668_t:CDS:2 [Rhizophagus irregularis]
MSSIEQTNATSQVSSITTINDGNNSTTASENHTGSRESYSGSYDYRPHNSSNQETIPTNSSPQTNNSSSSDTHSIPNRNDSTPRHSSQNENRDQEREHYSGYGSSSYHRNNRSDRSKGVARTIPDEIQNQKIKDVLTSITHGLSTSTYECMICCENIRPGNRTWSCGVCWAVFHLNCTQKWARKSSNGSRTTETWRCPGCQNISDVIPEKYKCFCGNVENPLNNRYLTPHSCGNVCGKKRDCPHNCTLLCHPGPCPPCSAMAPIQHCYCGRETFQLRCIDANYGIGKSCGETCGQLLSCGKHYCEKECHDGACPRCNINEMQKCYCGKTERKAECGDGIPIRCCEEFNNESNVWTGLFSCNNSCDRLLECGHHSCKKECHPVTGEPEPCPLDPSRVKTCPCGAESIVTLLGHERLSCTEEIPLCDNICKKLLPCGHECQESCHHDDCKPCTLSIRVKCRCGSTEYERICSEVVGKTGEPPTCDKICTGNRNCGRHQCNTRCCPSANKTKPSKKRVTQQDDDDENHRCTLICGKKLQCGRHYCQLLCHRSYCMRCLEASFEELTCHCGRTKIFPPIQCGEKVPPCTFDCIRSRNCGHPGIKHPCHNDDEPCPPCPYLVDKKCTCGKSTVKNVPCHQTNVSCGQVCDLPVSCGGHRCKRTCHLGDCLANTSNQCTQICGKPRKPCDHPCAVQCHAPAKCPEDTPCQTKITINCACGHLSQNVTCGATMENALKMGDRRLQCNDFCALAERNRKLANALEITDRVAIPEYEEDLFKYFAVHKDWAKNIETTLEEFIMKSQKPTLNFPPMKPPHRKFVHILCAHYRLSSESIDVEPKRSIVVKKKADTIIPPILLSQAYINYNKSNSSNSTSSATSSTAPEQLVRKQKQPFNAIYLSEIQPGMTIEELHKIIEPLMGRNKFQIKRVSDSDMTVLPLVGSMHMDELESLLAKLKLLFKDLIVVKGIASWVELCWVNSKYEVVWRERGKILNNFDGYKRVEYDFRIPSVIANNNPFDILANVSNSTSSARNTVIGSSDNNNKEQQQKVEPAANFDIVENWESIYDE